MAKRRILEEDIGFLISRAGAQLVKATNRELAPLGLKVRAYSALAAVCDEPDGITQRRLASDVGLDPSQIVALVDELENRELVVRKADPDDRRNRLITATPAGRELCTRARKSSAKVAADELSHIDPAVREALRAALYRFTFPERATPDD
ncbi:MarR family winged helix-turn-helix transcriptional regulator [Gordonia sp. ABSL49_1]|uniref:MarR family winged helix-turn-helix transcriptional regulator n=1 Tax=unclassified Gordonia (in: high G+C Gram-positive bacteria) TaxID=2657482 RepID=UPI001F0E66EB|nr:MarR family transcriptional regulator [Gordonia sp. ABSL49_1]MCH5645015.1 MarR family transcriptional regulator [Gordonia sp. ABSL49_1]